MEWCKWRFFFLWTIHLFNFHFRLLDTSTSHAICLIWIPCNLLLLYISIKRRKKHLVYTIYFFKYFYFNLMRLNYIGMFCSVISTCCRRFFFKFLIHLNRIIWRACISRIVPTKKKTRMSLAYMNEWYVYVSILIVCSKKNFDSRYSKDLTFCCCNFLLCFQVYRKPFVNYTYAVKYWISPSIQIKKLFFFVLFPWFYSLTDYEMKDDWKKTN